MPDDAYYLPGKFVPLHYWCDYFPSPAFFNALRAFLLSASPQAYKVHVSPQNFPDSCNHRFGVASPLYPMRSFSKIIEQSNQAGVGFLMVEIDAALTFLQVANTTTNKETAGRNRDNAHLAYKTILRYVDRVRLEGAEQVDFKEKFLELQNGLIKAGYAI